MDVGQINLLEVFHIENLISELTTHRKVLEVLGNTTMLEPSDKQLSGLGFNATVKDELIVKLKRFTSKGNKKLNSKTEKNRREVAQSG